MFARRTLGPLLLLTSLALAGCGGGGGHNNGSSTVLGKVVVLEGNTASPVPAANVSVDGGGPSTTTLSQGAFELDGISDGTHRIVANASVNGVGYTGSTQVLTQNNTTTSSATIILTPYNQQATVEGTVFDQYAQRPLYDARVFLAVPVSSTPGDVASLVAFTDSNGNFKMQNVPTGTYTLAASILHYQNTSTTVTNLQAGEDRRGVDLALVPSSNQATGAPSNVVVQSFTQPSTPPSPRLAGSASTNSVYEQIRRALSPAYARLVTSEHPGAHTRRAASADFGPSAIEMDVFFTPVTTTSLAGYRIYESSGSNGLTPYDFLQDPLANVYVDLSPMYVPNQQYNFAVTAVNTDQTESAASATQSVLPLSPVTLNQPGPGQVLSNPVTVSWNPVGIGQGETLAYAVFVYSQFPTINVSPVVSATNLSAGSTSYTLNGTLASGDYWVVVAASANQGAEISVSPITRFHVQ